MQAAPQMFGQIPQRDTRSRGRKQTQSALATRPATEARAHALRPTRVVAYVTCICAGVAIFLAWLVTETILSAVLGWVGAILLVCGLRTGRTYLPAYCGGLVTYAGGFYWMYGTIIRFGGFGTVISALIFALYVATGAILFLVFAVFHHHLGEGFEKLALRTPTAVVLGELLTVRLFPWHIGHTQIAFTPFVQIAGIGGAMAVTFVLFWVAEATWRVLVERERRLALAVPFGAFLASLGYGWAMMHTFAAPSGQSLDVLLVQGDPALIEKQDVELSWRNLTRMYEQSRQISHSNTLIVWPESAIPAYVRADLGSVRTEPGLPWLGDGSAFLAGGYSFNANEERYNAAFAVFPDGTVPAPYFKQILIPFGEYMPGASLFPWLNGLNANAGIFQAGTETKVFAYPMRRPGGGEYAVKVAPLICYEDNVPGLAREATRRGAQVLVNLTYDTWFGRTAAPYQHHLIAAFRAIENRRFLVRATSTGYSAVVDPLGRTVAHLPLYKESKAIVPVTPLDYQSTYTQYLGDKPWWALLVFTLGTIVVHQRRGKRPRLSHGPASSRLD